MLRAKKSWCNIFGQFLFKIKNDVIKINKNIKETIEIKEPKTEEEKETIEERNEKIKDSMTLKKDEEEKINENIKNGEKNENCEIYPVEE